MAYTEKDFNLLLESIVKEKELKPFPYILYGENGQKESIIFLKFVESYNRKGKEYVVFAEVFGDIRYGYNEKNNAYTEEISCPVSELKRRLEVKLNSEEYKLFSNKVNKESFIEETADAIISKFIQKRINVPPDLKLLIRYSISDAYEKGDSYRQYRTYRTLRYLKHRDESIDFSEYIKE